MYDDDTLQSEKEDDIVQPGDTYTYEWTVPVSAGPASEDSSSVLWSYYSHVNTSADVYSGLIGPIIVTRASDADPITAIPIDVNREFVVALSIIDENSAFHLQDSIDLAGVVVDDISDEDFVQSNRKHSINGSVKS